MYLEDLIDTDWKSYERKRFLKDSTKTKTDSFDPESFKHDGFDDREKYLDTYVPAMEEHDRLAAELNDFRPPRVGSINDSSYQALVIRYGILRQLIQQPGYCMDKSELMDSVQAWQQRLIEGYTEGDFLEDDDILHLARAAIDYENDIDDSELHLIYSYFELHNRSQESKKDYYTWLDFFKRLASIDRFPKVSRSDRPEHALDTIEKGLWSLQEQALVYEVSDAGTTELVGIPENYVEYIGDWLYYEMSNENFLQMLDSLAPFDDQSRLVEAREAFGVTTKTYGRNQERRESLVNAGVFPSELLGEYLTKAELKETVDRYGLEAHKRRTGEMISAIIDYFEQSQKSTTDDDPLVDHYLAAYEDIADGTVDHVPPKLQDSVDVENPADKLDILFERATGEIFTEIFNLEGTSLLGQGAGGVVADGEVEQDGQWLLWDNKRRAQKFKLDSNTRSKIKNYIDTKDNQHSVEWFLVIAPEFTKSAERHAEQLEIETGKDIRLVRAADFRQLAAVWRDNYAATDRELPLSVFFGSGLFNVDLAVTTIDRLFS